MRYDKAHKQMTRTRVLDAAARAIRAAGPDRVGVAAVMADAGLTHGGFYAHFDGKDALIAAAIEHMFEQSAERLRASVEGHDPRQALATYIASYLSRTHRDACASGCPVAALASDLPRLPRATRKVFARGVSQLTDVIAGMLRRLGQDHAGAMARSTVAELVGALSIARIEPDIAQSNAILSASKRELLRRLGLQEVA